MTTECMGRNFLVFNDACRKELKVTTEYTGRNFLVFTDAALDAREHITHFNQKTAIPVVGGVDEMF